MKIRLRDVITLQASPQAANKNRRKKTEFFGGLYVIVFLFLFK